MDLDLMIIGTEIDFEKGLYTGKLVKQNVDVRQGIFVLDGNGI
jgi:hypothetical protein